MLVTIFEHRLHLYAAAVASPSANTALRSAKSQLWTVCVSDPLLWEVVSW